MYLTVRKKKSNRTLPGDVVSVRTSGKTAPNDGLCNFKKNRGYAMKRSIILVGSAVLSFCLATSAFPQATPNNFQFAQSTASTTALMSDGSFSDIGFVVDRRKGKSATVSEFNSGTGTFAIANLLSNEYAFGGNAHKAKLQTFLPVTGGFIDAEWNATSPSSKNTNHVSNNVNGVEVFSFTVQSDFRDASVTGTSSGAVSVTSFSTGFLSNDKQQLTNVILP